MAHRSPRNRPIFSLDKYSNVISWDLKQYATGVAVANALTVKLKAENPGRDPKDIEGEVAAKTPALLGVFQMGETMMAGGMSESQRAEIYDGTMGAGFYATIGTGNALKQSLPVAVEMNNSHGIMELEIPANDPNVADVIRVCTVTAVAPASVVAEASGNKSVEAPPVAAADESHPASTGATTGASNSATPAPPTTPDHVSGTAEVSPHSISGIPSFDCAKASSKVENIICSDSAIANTDSDMATFYKRNLIAAGASTDSVKKGQRDFIAKRNLCADAECISAAYKERTSDLVQLGHATP